MQLWEGPWSMTLELDLNGDLLTYEENIKNMPKTLNFNKLRVCAKWLI